MPGDFSDYISLQEASKCCVYTQQYLSLRARQGKLKAVKFGRNWVTKTEWVQEYSERARQYNSKNIFVEKVLVREIKALPPKNLPVAQSKAANTLRASVSLASICILLGASFAFGGPSFNNVSSTFSPYAKEVAASAEVLIAASMESYGTVRKDIVSFKDKFASVYYQTGSVAELFREYGGWIFEKIGDSK
jgi:hypothetical protein